MLIHANSENGLKKDDIVENLHDFLQRNATRLANNASLEGYWSTGVARRTPFKTRVSSDEPEVVSTRSVGRGRGKRATKVKEEPV